MGGPVFYSICGNNVIHKEIMYAKGVCVKRVL